MREKQPQPSKMGAFFSRWKLCALLLCLGALIVTISILMDVLPTEPASYGKLYWFFQQLVAAVGGTCLTAGIVDLFLGFSNVREFIDQVVGKTYRKWTGQLLGEEPIDFAGLSEFNLRQLLHSVSLALAETEGEKDGRGQNEGIDETALELIPRVLSLIAKREYYVYSSLKTIIIPNSKEGSTSVKTILDAERVTGERDYSETMWFESEQNRNAYVCQKLIIDGIDLTEAYQESKSFPAVTGARRFSDSQYGLTFSVPYPDSHQKRHTIERISLRKNYTRGFVTMTAKVDVLTKRCDRTFTIDGGEALRWKLFSVANAAFQDGQPSARNYVTNRITNQTVEYNFYDWVLPGAGFTYVIFPVPPPEPQRGPAPTDEAAQSDESARTDEE
ncbi:MAG: hypothetical protein LBJ11_01840 [Oscillospiraceae bacterium]|nr:hypothetical protein [Oscillospiraceae bacterium]